MANAIKRFWSSLFEADDNYEQEELDYIDETPAAPVKEHEPAVEYERRQPSRRQQTNIVSLPGSAANKMIVFRPVNYEDTQNIIDNLKSHKPVIVNMEQIDVETAQRILDFMSGACYAVDGRVCRVSTRIFIVAPANVDIIASPDGFRE